MPKSSLLLFTLAIYLCVHFTNSSGIVSDGQGKRLLVLLDQYGLRETHSTFFKSLKSRGFQVTFKLADDADLALSKYNEYMYDQLILFCPNVVEFGGTVTTKAVIDFVDAGGNVLVAANSQLSDPIKEIAGECGVEFSDEDTFVIDRFNSDVNDDGHDTLVVADNEYLINNKMIVGDKAKSGSPFLYKGIGMTVDPENPLLIEVLTGSPTSYTYNPESSIADYPHTVGKSTLMISALQARNNARVLFVGSLEFFSNDYFEASVEKSLTKSKRFERSGNEDLSVGLTQWLFMERGALRVAEITHNKAGEKSAPSDYTIKEDLEYSIKIEEMVNGKWEVFKATDVQLEFIMLDPYVRTTLKSTTSGSLATKFMIPDVYGVFKLNVDYKRVGYTNLFSSVQVSVRPLEHTQYERFITAAYPYYASSAAMIIGVFVFSFIQLYHHDAEKTKSS